MKRLVVVLLLAIMVMALVSSAIYAEAVKPVLVKKPTIAILPLQITGAKDATRSMLPELYKGMFETQGFEVTMGVPVEQAMNKLGIATTRILDNKEQLLVGQSLGVDYILGAGYKFRTAKVWIGLGPKSRTILAIESKIVDVKQSTVVYEKKTETYNRSDSKYQTGVGLLVSYPASMFMGGTLSKAEKGAAEKSLEATYAEFFASLVKTNTKIR